MRWRNIGNMNSAVARPLELTVRLQALVRHGVLERVRYQERPERFEYGLTERGPDLYPVLCTLWSWGDKWLPHRDGPSVVLRERSAPAPGRLGRGGHAARSGTGLDRRAASCLRRADRRVEP
ncbi:MAG: helix-turn-helix domain-containing protein [Candidatus Binatia bacterium]